MADDCITFMIQYSVIPRFLFSDIILNKEEAQLQKLRAEQQKQRAEQQQQRAEQAELKAVQLAERLRAMGIDPDTLD